MLFLSRDAHRKPPRCQSTLRKQAATFPFMSSGSKDREELFFCDNCVLKCILRRKITSKWKFEEPVSSETELIKFVNSSQIISPSRRQLTVESCQKVCHNVLIAAYWQKIFRWEMELRACRDPCVFSRFGCYKRTPKEERFLLINVVTLLDLICFGKLNYFHLVRFGDLVRRVDVFQLYGVVNLTHYR